MTRFADDYVAAFGTYDDEARFRREMDGHYRAPAVARRQLLAERRRTWREVVGLLPVA